MSKEPKPIRAFKPKAKAQDNRDITLQDIRRAEWFEREHRAKNLGVIKDA